MHLYLKPQINILEQLPGPLLYLTLRKNPMTLIHFDRQFTILRTELVFALQAVFYQHYCYGGLAN